MLSVAKRMTVQQAPSSFACRDLTAAEHIERLEAGLTMFKSTLQPRRFHNSKAGW